MPGVRELSGILNLPAGGWVAARAHGGEERWPGMNGSVFAQTSPVWIGEVGSYDPGAADSAARDLLRALDFSEAEVRERYRRGARPSDSGTVHPGPRPPPRVPAVAPREGTAGLQTGTAPRSGAKRASPPAHKREDGLERRPPVGIARERETCADDAGPCQHECRTTSFITGGVNGRTRSCGFLRVAPGAAPRRGRNRQELPRGHSARAQRGPREEK